MRVRETLIIIVEPAESSVKALIAEGERRGEEMTTTTTSMSMSTSTLFARKDVQV